MNNDNSIHDELTEGYASAIESFEDMEGTLADLQDALADALSDLQGDLRATISTMRSCLKALRRLQSAD